jgi:hypothetical protein
MPNNAIPTCHLCRRDIYTGEARAEYDGQGEEDFCEDSLLYYEQGAPILAIHWACGQEDNAARAEAAHFGSIG